MSEIQSIGVSTQDLKLNPTTQSTRPGEYAAVEAKIHSEESSEKSAPAISYGKPNEYAGTVHQALLKVCGSKSATTMDTLMQMVHKDPSKRVSEMLLEMVNSAQSSSAQASTAHGAGQINPALMNLPMVTPIKGQALYPVPEGTPEAWVAPEWSADAVSDRIMQLAGFFMATLPGDPEENMKKIKEAMEKGFQNANDTIGAVPADLAQLYNNTYEKTMSKWDQFVKEFRAEKTQNEMSAAFQEELEKGSWTRPVGI